MNTKQWRQIQLSLIYTIANYDDVVDAFVDGEHEGQLGTEEELQALLAIAESEVNEAHKLALAYFKLYPKEIPTILSDEMWDSIDCTFGNWINNLAIDPEKTLSRYNWAGKVSRAYFYSILRRGMPLHKSEMVEAVKNHLKDQQ